MEKSFVTIEKCIICKENTENLFIDKRLTKRFEMNTSFPNSICDKCKEKYLSKGVLLLNPENGKLMVLKDEAFKRLFNAEIPKGKIAFVHDDVLDKIIKLRDEGTKK